MSQEYLKPPGYVALLRENRDFRRVWLAQLVSELGDWLNFVALMQLINRFSASAEVASWLIVIEMLPLVVLAPFAGVVADKFERRTVMIVADVLRAGFALAYLFVDRPGRLWLVFLISGLQFSITAFFEPARSAIVPSVVSGPALVTANTLTGLTWSMMLAIGAAVGGVLAGVFSSQTAFIVDSLTFMVSAAILFGLRVRRAAPGPGERAERRGGIGPALRYLRDRPRVAAAMTVKSGITLVGGGMWILAVVYGQKVFPMGKDGALSVGLLYGVQGLGSLVGVWLIALVLQSTRRSRVWILQGAFVARSALFLVWALAPNILWVAAAIVAVNATGSLLWVVSTTMLQEMTPDDLRGRIFSLEQGMLNLAMMSTILGGGHVLDRNWTTPQGLALWLSIGAAGIAAAWLVVCLRWPRWNPAAPPRPGAESAEAA